MSDARLRELERRWHESGADEDKLAWIRAQVRAGQGPLFEALELLGKVEELARGVGTPGLRDRSLADVAWSHAELDRGEQALALTHGVQQLQGLARVAATRERVNGEGSGQELFAKSLAEIQAAYTRHEGLTPEAVASRAIFLDWLRALADTGRSNQLTDRWLEVSDARPPNERSTLFSQAAPALSALARGDEAARRLLVLLEPNEIQRAANAVAQFDYAEDALRVHVQTAVEGLLRLSEQTAPRAIVARRVLSQLRERPTLVDELSYEPLAALLPHLEGFWAEVEELSAELQRRGRRFEARILILAGLRALIEVEPSEEHVARFQRELEQAWQARDTAQRHRMLTRLIPLAPGFCQGAACRDLLREQLERAGYSQRDTYFLNEVWNTLALAAPNLGADDAYPLLVSILDAADGADEKSGGGPNWLVFESRDACATSAVELGGARALPLVARVAEAAGRALRRGGPSEGDYFYLRSLARSGWAACRLGDGPAAREYFTEVLDAMPQLHMFDRVELLTELVDLAGRLPDHRLRHEVLARTIEAITLLEEQDVFKADLVAQLSRLICRLK